MHIIVDNKIHIQDTPADVLKRCRDRLCFPNPKWLENDRMGYWNGETPRMLYYLHKEAENVYSMPRGFIRQLQNIARNYTIDDRTRKRSNIEFDFNAELYPLQQKAVDAILKKRFGVLNAPPGSGKTVMALYAISQRKQPSLVIVHTKELMYQWQEKACQFLGIPKEDIGLIGDGKNEIGKRLTVGIVNSLSGSVDMNEVKESIGFLIVDECHHTPARTFTDVISAFDSHYMLGLSATPYRRDKLTKLIYFYCGDEVYHIKQLNRNLKASLKIRETDFWYPFNEDYQKMISELVDDHKRNKLIATDVLHEAKKDGIAVVLSDRKQHCQTLHKMICKQAEVKVLTGDIAIEKRKQIIEDLRNGKGDVLIATTQLIGEGFDFPELTSLFLATPIKFCGKLKQSVGRVLREAEGKSQALIYDYVDMPGVLQASFKSRCWAYKDLGIE